MGGGARPGTRRARGRAGEDRTRAAALAAAEQALRDRENQWQERQAALAREVEGLEKRVRNQRQRLYAAPPPAAAPPPRRAEAPAVVEVTLLPTALQRLAGSWPTSGGTCWSSGSGWSRCRSTGGPSGEGLLAEIEAAGRQLADARAAAGGRGAGGDGQRRGVAAAAGGRGQGGRGWRASGPGLAVREAALEGERSTALTPRRAWREEAAAGELRRLDELAALGGAAAAGA